MNRAGFGWIDVAKYFAEMLGGILIMFVLPGALVLALFLAFWEL